jgi:hypothetical protein
MEEHKAAKPMTWVKDKDGNTYICPKEELVDAKKLSKEELGQYCLDENDKPWND